MSGRRPAAAAAAGAGARAEAASTRGPCPCTNISMMQLFHELKQQFPAVADDVVSACIADHCHDRPACRERLRREAVAAVPRALPYPPSLHGPRTDADGSAHKPPQEHPPNYRNSAAVATSEPPPPPPLTLKPPISPCMNKRFPPKNAATKATLSGTHECVKSSTTTTTTTCDATDAASTGAVRKSTAIRPASLDLTPRTCNEDMTSVNVSVNVNLVPSPGQTTANTRRHSTVLQVTPEPVWCQHLLNPNDISPRSYTSVNLTLRTPTSEPQNPIDICSSPASGPSLTYTTSSFDRRQGLQSRLQITVGPGTGVGTVTAMRSRPRSSYHPDGAPVEVGIPPPVRAESLPDLANSVPVAATTNHVVLLSRQLERKEQLRNELETGRERLCEINKEVQALRLEKTPNSRSRLKKEIKHLQAQCERLTREVDRHSESRVPLGETNAEFYRHIYTGQRGSLRPPQRSQQRHQQRWQPPEGDNEPRWPCHICTFRNHPLMDKCEQCEMPRILLVSAGPGENIHIRFSPGNTTRVIHSWVV